MGKTALIAIGGNSLIRAGERGTIEEQLKNAYSTAHSIAKIVKSGWNIIITHGNGPQAGAQLLRSERAASEVYTHSLDMCVATTQSEIGYILQRAFRYEFGLLGLDKQILTIPTMVLVDLNDQAFKNPTKPIGPFYSKSDADYKSNKFGWNIIEDSSRGWRRVVASPEPIAILELSIIKKILSMGFIAIALGGGGIPVIKNNDGKIEGVEAVIDKDRSSALLASELDVDIFIISTDTDYVYLNYRKQNQKAIDKANVKELEIYYNKGHFPAGSMGPKIESVIKFIKNGGRKAIITSNENIMYALQGNAGTMILPK